MKNKTKFTTLDIEIAVTEFFGIRRNIIVPNVFWGLGFGHELDLCILSQSGYATEVEIKISKRDLFRDKDKRHNHYSAYLKRLFFAVPYWLVDEALDEIPETAGLFSIVERPAGIYAVIVRKPINKKGALPWPEAHRLKLCELGTMRILGLKKTMNRLLKESRRDK